MQWNEITYGQLLQLQALGETAAPANIIKVLYPGKTLGDLPGDALAFMDVELEPDEIRDCYHWGHTYHISLDFGKYTVEQYSDFQAMVNNDRPAHEVLATLLIPDEGYGNIPFQEVVSDILSAPCTEVMSAVNFTIRECETLLRHSLWYSALEIMTMKEIPLKKRMRLLWATCKFTSAKS